MATTTLQLKIRDKNGNPVPGLSDLTIPVAALKPSGSPFTVTITPGSRLAANGTLTLDGNSGRFELEDGSGRFELEEGPG